jgi:hypothetical protein
LSQPPGWPTGPQPVPPPFPHQQQPQFPYQPQPPGPYGPPVQPVPQFPSVPPGWPALPPPPVRKRRTGLKITLSVVGAVLVLCAVGGFLVAKPILDQYPATLTAPQTVAGMSKQTDPSLATAAEQMVTSLTTTLHPSSAIGAFYAPNNDRNQLVLIAGVTSLIFSHGKQIDDAFAGESRSGIPMSGIATVDPGPMGGEAKCGDGMGGTGTLVSLCVWADYGSLGLVVAYNRQPAEAAELMRRMRAEVLHRG